MAALNLAGKTSGFIKLKSPDVASNATVELPNKDGILATLDDVTGGGGDAVATVADGCIYLNNQTITNDYTFPAGKNGMSAGPIDVNGTVEVGDGTWTIVGEGGSASGDSATLESLGIPNHDKVTVVDNGNVGIGTDSPADFGTNFKTLQVNGEEYGVVQASNDNGVIAELMGAGDIGYVGTRSNHSFALRTNDTERMSIASNGRVKINSANATANARLTLKSNPDELIAMSIQNGGGPGVEYITFLNSSGAVAGSIEHVAGNSIKINGLVTTMSQVDGLETKLADRDKIIDKLLAKVEALEEKLKKVK